ncbi:MULTISPECIES: Lrp/AsnC family transcriptional regulator [Commensalibacter]|uniref:AsnC family transcriptional regulator n=2 Tax=Commensalibacter TaxID=1079922 RepID=W7DV51_9PROT|nr:MULTISPECIES: Lrp/AsnC family transcriptional regulator [Commensalibacter]EUK18123.1 AsnC family transcriptional regulator [Commensalibacter papalotli (ex Servin-Garciduenas et al. 2014)]CAI3936551.1 DNA-binding transcriptional regulator [Commensalibacter papalotli (ex Botero et al. 2024)]CAI3939098.1 DNA-binding transcriptional regulator [Commensalibacter papalotli (ex Botero et al. 2024)]
MAQLVELDRIDWLILDELQKDGRITNIDLAQRVGISAPPCLRRVRRLEAMGVIKSYHAVIDNVSVGWSLSVFVLVGLDSQKESVLTEFETQMAELPEVRECHMVRGGVDFLIRFIAKDAEDENRLTHELTSNPHVARVQTLQIIRTSLQREGVPLAKPAE